MLNKLEELAIDGLKILGIAIVSRLGSMVTSIDLDTGFIICMLILISIDLSDIKRRIM